MCAYLLYTASIGRMELNHELEGMQNKAVMVCFSKSIIGRSEEDDGKYKGSQLPGEY